MNIRASEALKITKNVFGKRVLSEWDFPFFSSSFLYFYSAVDAIL
jgi:hypothetical protein